MTTPASAYDAPIHISSLTLLVSHPSAAEEYREILQQKFPLLKVLTARNEDEIGQHLPSTDILLSPSFPGNHLHLAKKLRWFQCSNAGVDSVIRVQDRVGGLLVTNASGMHGELIADYVMGVVTALHWNLPLLQRQQTMKQWKPRAYDPLSTKTMGVVGLGAIGETIAMRAKGDGMKVVGNKRDISAPVDGVDALYGAKDLRSFLPMCDFVVLAVPLTVETAKLIGRDELACMRPDAFLINIARGAVVDEAALVEALNGNLIAGAALDVFETEPLPVGSPLWTMPNVIVTPHIAGYPTNYVERMSDIFADNLTRFTAGRPLRNVVNLALGY